MLISYRDPDRNDRNPEKDPDSRFNARRIVALLVVYGLLGLALAA